MQDISTAREAVLPSKSKSDSSMPNSGDSAVSQLLGKLDEVSSGQVAQDTSYSPHIALQGISIFVLIRVLSFL